MLNLNVDNLTIPDYNNLFINNYDFYDYIPTEIFLVFQTDTMINTQYKHLINDFLEYDYVGAPWNGGGGRSRKWWIIIEKKI
jgi:hypothetical protein